MSKSDSPCRVKIGWLVDGDIVVMISADIFGQRTFRRRYPEFCRVT